MEMEMEKEDKIQPHKTSASPIVNTTEVSKTESTEFIGAMIMEFRGQQVMIDRDLARLYGVTTKVLNQAVKRNIERFPDDFMFLLTMDEYSRSQIVTLKPKRGQNIKYPPFAFTENGIAMLSSVLHSPAAIQANIAIMRAFTAMRQLPRIHAESIRRIEIVERHQVELALHQAEIEHRLEEVFSKIDSQLVPSQGIFFDGQVFDAHRFVSDLIRSAKQRVVLFDNYVDDTTLALLDKRADGVETAIYTKKVTSNLSADMLKHDTQYPPIEVHEFAQTHDRFLCIDDTVYHIGASLKDLGTKWFAFSRMEIPASTLLSKMKE